MIWADVRCVEVEQALITPSAGNITILMFNPEGFGLHFSWRLFGNA